MSVFDKNGRTITAGAKIRESLTSIYRNRKYSEIDVSWNVKTQGDHLGIEIRLLHDGKQNKQPLDKIRNSIKEYSLKNRINCTAHIFYSGDDSVLSIRVNEKASYLRFRRGRFLSNFQRVQRLTEKFLDSLGEYADNIVKQPTNLLANEEPHQPDPVQEDSIDWKSRVRPANAPVNVWSKYPSDGGLKM